MQQNTIKLIAACALFYWAAGTFFIQNVNAQPAELTQPRSTGSTRLKVFGFQVYDATLWVEPGFNADAYERTRFALEITYLRNFDGGAVAERSIKEMRNQSPLTEMQATQWLNQMRSIFPNIQKGDTLVGVHRPGVGASFSFNGKALGDIPDAEFARRFFGIWLSPKTSEPQMRRELLYGASGK
jgi:Chalcone isomerase-like